jgi:hypothetical protein
MALMWQQLLRAQNMEWLRRQQLFQFAYSTAQEVAATLA